MVDSLWEYARGKRYSGWRRAIACKGCSRRHTNLLQLRPGEASGAEASSSTSRSPRAQNSRSLVTPRAAVNSLSTSGSSAFSVHSSMRGLLEPRLLLLPRQHPIHAKLRGDARSHACSHPRPAIPRRSCAASSSVPPGSPGFLTVVLCSRQTIPTAEQQTHGSWDRRQSRLAMLSAVSCPMAHLRSNRHSAYIPKASRSPVFP